MEDHSILEHIDHTLLKPTCGWEDIRALCVEAERWHTASVCIPPCYVGRVRAAFPSLCICTVIGFPLGYAAPAVKAFEARQAVADGADEIDLVINLTDVKNGAFDAVTSEIRQVRAQADARVLKVIVETCYLTRAEKIRLCHCVSEAGADFIKTSTGFGTGGACLEDIALFKEHIAPGVRIKASGGVRTREQFERYLAAGCARIGASGAVAALGLGESPPGKGKDY